MIPATPLYVGYHSYETLQRTSIRFAVLRSCVVTQLRYRTTYSSAGD